jgi:hypothetical protein
MSRRLPPAVPIAAVLLAAALCASRATAKPPDLPLMPNDTLAPPAPASNLEVLLAPTNPVSQARLHRQGLWLAPEGGGLWCDLLRVRMPKVEADQEDCALEQVLFRMRPSARRCVAECLLWGAHPILSWTPVGDYLNDLDDESCQDVLTRVEEDLSGSLLIGVGVNSDAGLSGSIVVNEQDFDLLPFPCCPCDLIGACPCPSPCPCAGCACCWQMVPFALFVKGRPAPEPIAEMPKEIPDDAASACPWMRQQQCRPDRHVILMADPDVSRSVLENLQRLQAAEALLQAARDFGRCGRICEALQCLDLVVRLCPGRFEDRAAEAAVEMLAPFYSGCPTAPAAEEQSEPANGEEEADPNRHIEELLEQSEDLRQIREEWEHAWKGLPVTPQNVERAVFGVNPAHRVSELMKRFNAYFKEGKYCEAECCAAQAHELCPDDPVPQAALHIVRLQRCTHEAKAPCKDEPCCDELGREEPCGCCPACERECQTVKLLQQPVSLHLDGVPLRQVIDDLNAFTGLNITVDEAALAAEEISLELPVCVRLDGVSLHSALLVVLHPARLTYLLKDDVVEVTTSRAARDQLQRKTYAVGDILDTEVTCPGLSTGPGRRPTPEALVHAVTTGVRPQSWRCNGGAGTIDYCAKPCGRCLVVNQTADVQRRVERMLGDLRRRASIEKAKACEPPDAPAHCEEQEPPCGPSREEHEQAHQAVEARKQVEEMMRKYQLLMYAGCYGEAAALAKQAYRLDPKAVAADPLVYKMQLLAAPAKPAALRPCLPPVDPGVVLVLDKMLAEEEVRPALCVVVEEASLPVLAVRAVAKPFHAAGACAVACGKDGGPDVPEDLLGEFLRAVTGGHGTLEIGLGLDGSLCGFTQLRPGGAVWHLRCGAAGLTVWSVPDGGACDGAK